MTAESLYLKYRPKVGKEVIGQDSIVASLEKVTKKGTSHAFLFTGPSGCGKTTLARLTAIKVGCHEQDIREIDAATYTSIDDMRQVTAALQYKPLGGSGKRALIIDECHALSKQAWQALLKAVEEPPAWQFWMLCTTEASRVPDTIRTRCAKYEVKPIHHGSLFDLLARIADSERMKVSDDILDVCVKEAGGSARQAISNLVVCETARDRGEAAELLKSAEGASEAIELARALVKDAGWTELRALLGGLKEVNPESVRHVVRAYLTTVALGAKSEKAAVKAVRMLEHFATPFNSGDGQSPLLIAVGRCLWT